MKPRGLQPGDTIMFVAPSGDARMEAVERARGRLEGLGYKVRMPEDIGRARGYLAGSDERRAEELMAAFTDPEVDAVFPVTGGYGTTRMLQMLDYEKIAANPKVFTGFSDITGLHLALTAKCNMVTFHSPNPQYGLGSQSGLPQFHAKYFWGNILAENADKLTGLVYAPPKEDLPIVTLRPGVARGRLTGGNLSLVAALMGTPYEVQTEGRVLLLEDISEAPYRVDRMLSQLRLAGKLDSVAAVLLGAYYKCDSDHPERSLTLDQVFDDYFAEAPYPVLKWFPSGHGPWNATLPMNVLAEVDAEARTVRLLESAVTAGE